MKHNIISIGKIFEISLGLPYHQIHAPVLIEIENTYQSVWDQGVSLIAKIVA